jgi:hypothetical protein
MITRKKYEISEELLTLLAKLSKISGLVATCLQLGFRKYNQKRHMHRYSAFSDKVELGLT